MWEPKGKSIDRESLGSLEPEEILFEFEGEPLTFVARDRDDGLLLVHSLSVFDRTSRYLVSPIDDRTLSDLKAGRIDIRAGLRQSRCWVADIGDDASVGSIWLVKFESIPDEVLPRSGAMLTPELEPLFRIRLIGQGVGPGKTSAADVRMAAQAAESGLRGLARVVLEKKTSAGQVPREVRYYSNLPYQSSRVASFEIAFGRPRDKFQSVDDEIFEDMGRLLEVGLDAVRSGREDFSAIEALSPAQAVQLFEAIRALTPPTQGGVERIEIGGGLVEGRLASKVLTRDDRARTVQRIKAVRRPPRKEPPFRIAGVIDRPDRGMSWFTLRELEPRDLLVLDGKAEVDFRFDDHLLQDVADAWISSERVSVVGEWTGEEFKALAIEAVGDAAEARPGESEEPG